MSSSGIALALGAVGALAVGGLAVGGVVAEAGGSLARRPNPGRFSEMDPDSRARLFRGQPKNRYPERGRWPGRDPYAHWRLPLTNPFVPSGEVRYERMDNNSKRITAEHFGLNRDPRQGAGGAPMRHPASVLQTWVLRRDGEIVASENYLGAHLYTEPPTRAEFDRAWDRTRLPPRSPEAVAAWLPDWTPPVTPAPKRATSRVGGPVKKSPIKIHNALRERHETAHFDAVEVGDEIGSTLHAAAAAAHNDAVSAHRYDIGDPDAATKRATAASSAADAHDRGRKKGGSMAVEHAGIEAVITVKDAVNRAVRGVKEVRAARGKRTSTLVKFGLVNTMEIMRAQGRVVLALLKPDGFTPKQVDDYVKRVGIDRALLDFGITLLPAKATKKPKFDHPVPDEKKSKKRGRK